MGGGGVWRKGGDDEEMKRGCKTRQDGTVNRQADGAWTWGWSELSTPGSSVQSKGSASPGTQPSAARGPILGLGPLAPNEQELLLFIRAPAN